MSLTAKLTQERRARLAAERLLEMKQAELHAAQRKLGQHARALSEEIVETRAEVQTMRDENRRYRTDLSEAQEKVAVAERRLWHSIRSIRDGFAFFDADGRMIGANEAWVSVFDGIDEVRPGVTFVRLLQLATDEGIVNIGDEPPTAWRSRMIDRWHAPMTEPVTMRLWNDRFLRVRPQRGAGGDVVVLANDITAAVRYESRLREARARAEAANRAKSAFLANMSHEIRTPMNGVVGMADVLADTDLSEDQRLYVDTIRQSGEALLTIINDVLDYSKIEARKLELHVAPFDLERTIHEVILLLQPAAREKGLQLLVDHDPALPLRFVGDRGRIRQVLLNLAGNAVKFTRRGHVLVRTVGLVDPATGAVHLHVTVEDTGIGIAQDVLHRIFDDFSQVDDDRDRAFEGTGLGLAISRSLVDLMDGRIWVDSEPGVGSVFGFRVPLPPAGDDPALPPVPAGLRRVMVVDPVEAGRLILARQLETLGLDVVCCASGQEALKRLDTGTGLVLADRTMPGVDGPAVARAVRDAGGAMPVVVIGTGRTGAAELAQDGVAAILQRPVGRRELRAALALAGQAAAPETPRFATRRRRTGLLPPSPRDTARRAIVLAAEDNRTNRTVFERMLKGAELDLHFAASGGEAVELHDRLTPDVIFMDVSMPGMDGKEATRRIRAVEQGTGRRVPIVAMTAHVLDEDRADILSAGLDHFLPKPLQRDAVCAMIRFCLPDEVRDPFPDRAG